jgi:hypothetical protein
MQPLNSEFKLKIVCRDFVPRNFVSRSYHAIYVMCFWRIKFDALGGFYIGTQYEMHLQYPLPSIKDSETWSHNAVSITSISSNSSGQSLEKAISIFHRSLPTPLMDSPFRSEAQKRVRLQDISIPNRVRRRAGRLLTATSTLCRIDKSRFIVYMSSVFTAQTVNKL